MNISQCSRRSHLKAYRYGYMSYVCRLEVALSHICMPVRLSVCLYLHQSAYWIISSKNMLVGCIFKIKKQNKIQVQIQIQIQIHTIIHKNRYYTNIYTHGQKVRFSNHENTPVPLIQNPSTHSIREHTNRPKTYEWGGTLLNLQRLDCGLCSRRVEAVAAKQKVWTHSMLPW